MDINKVNAEVLGILNTLGEEYIDKIPQSVLDHLKQNCDVESISEYDKTKSIMEQGISKEAIALFTLLKIQYFCDSEEEKKRLIEKIQKNSQAEQ